MDIEKAIDIIEKWEFFYGQRAGLELWQDKPTDVQNQDIAEFNRDMETLKQMISDMQELQEYRQIGTVDECRAAMEKQIPMESSLTKISEYALIMRYSSCPSCLGVTRSALDAFPKYCSNCGQALKLED